MESEELSVSREQLVEMTRREVENLQNNRIDLAPEILRVRTADYYDPDRWRLEVDRIFKRVPLALGFSCEMREPGSYLAMQVADVPVLITRGEDHEIHAFVNMCSHRGNFVVPEGTGHKKNLRCGYHAWTYNLAGDLISVFDEDNFGHVDKSCLGLTPLPVAERAGLIWVTLNPNSNVDIDVFLAGYGEMLEHLGFNDCHMAGRQSFAGPNWKVAYDGYRDFYHVPILHHDSFGPEGPFQPDFYSWGPHVRVSSPKGHDEVANTPEADWTHAQMTPGVWTIFPNVSIAGGVGSGFMFSQMFPGASPGESQTTQNFLQYGAPEDVDPDEMKTYMQFMQSVVEREDYSTGFNVQKALATGAKEFSMFGRNEGGGQLFHRWVDALIETSDADLPALLENGIDAAC